MIAGLRAALIAAALGIYGVAAAPIPSVSARTFKDPALEDVFRDWAAMLSSAGRPTTPDEVREVAWSFGRAAYTGQRDLLEPVKPILDWTGTGQDWGLFGYPETRPHRLFVEGLPEGDDPEGGWQRLFQTPGGGSSSLSGALRYRRTRGVYQSVTGAKRPRPIYRRLARWVADRTFDERDDLAAVRVGFERFQIGPPGAELLGTARRLVLTFERPAPGEGATP